MNALFNSALRQSSSIRKDLGAFADAPTTSSAALQGQLNASITSFSRTIEDYDRMAKQEPVPTKQEKAFERLKSFRAELLDYREQIGRLKKEQEEAQASQNHSELLGRRPHQTATPENPYANSTQYAAQHSHFRPANPTSAYGASPADYNRETHAAREQNFMSSTNAQLDEFLDRGRAVLGDLGNQRDILKGTQRKLYGVANTLGISGDTIRMVERRAKQDKWIFWIGVVVFFGFCYFVMKWLSACSGTCSKTALNKTEACRFLMAEALRGTEDFKIKVNDAFSELLEKTSCRLTKIFQSSVHRANRLLFQLWDVKQIQRWMKTTLKAVDPWVA